MAPRSPPIFRASGELNSTFLLIAPARSHPMRLLKANLIPAADRRTEGAGICTRRKSHGRSLNWMCTLQTKTNRQAFHITENERTRRRQETELVFTQFVARPSVHPSLPILFSPMLCQSSPAKKKQMIEEQKQVPQQSRPGQAFRNRIARGKQKTPICVSPRNATRQPHEMLCYAARINALQSRSITEGRKGLSRRKS